MSSILKDADTLKKRLNYLIEEHKKAAAYCMAYNNLAAWLNTMSAAITVALSAVQASSAQKGAIGIALIVLTAVTTGISFWQNVCRFAQRFTVHSTAISRCGCLHTHEISQSSRCVLHIYDVRTLCRYRGLLATLNNIFTMEHPAEQKALLEKLLKEKEEATRVAPSIPPWITGNMKPGNNPGTLLAFVMLWLCNCFCGNPTTSEDAQVERHAGSQQQSDVEAQHPSGAKGSPSASKQLPAYEVLIQKSKHPQL